MSDGNSIARVDRDGGGPTGPVGFELPPALAARYDVRVVDAADGQQRIGLFRSSDGANPAIEISNDRIAAHGEDRETVAALVAIAQHSGWNRIAVDGSPEFRQAVWEAATREGLAVSGYEATFAEQERAEQARRAAAERRNREIREQAPPAGRVEPGATPAPTDPAPTLGDDRQGLSDGDRRLLLTLSRHTEDRKGLDQAVSPELDAFEREVRSERLDDNRAALTAALELALESPTLATAFERSGYTAETLRDYGRDGRWDGELADAIYLVRSGRHRDTLGRDGELAAALADEIAADREDRTSAAQITAGRERPVDRGAGREEAERHAASDRRRESEELAELFLHGASERVAAEPRLAQAREAQTAMEQHIGEVFNGDAGRMATANLESRQMISDALRRGLDVSVREPTPVRQVEPAHIRPDMER